MGRGGRRYLPYVFANRNSDVVQVLRSDVAVKVSIEIMDAYVEMRRMLISNASLFHRLDNIELKQLQADQKLSKSLRH